LHFRGPVVPITHPRRAILATKPAHIVPGPEEARVRAWSSAKITSAQARIDDGAWTDLCDIDELNWSFPIPGDTLAKGEHTLEVRLTDANDAEGSDRITFACDLSGRYKLYPMVEPVVRETKFC
jgi:3',5'-cyclic-AMP phosphodiesterase